MSQTFRYPREAATPKGADESSQIITLINNSNAALAQGGPAAYANITPWHFDGKQDESPYNCIQLEWTADGAILIGDGTLAGAIGLWACRGDLSTGQRYLLAVIGMGFGQIFPQVRIIGAQHGFAQIIGMVSSFDGLAVGGITGSVPVSDAHITVTARPWRVRSYVG